MSRECSGSWLVAVANERRISRRELSGSTEQARKGSRYLRSPGPQQLLPHAARDLSSDCKVDAGHIAPLRAIFRVILPTDLRR